MRATLLILLIGLITALCGSDAVRAQGPFSEEIQTDLNWDTQSSGCMFDVTATNDLTICGLTLAYRRMEGGAFVATVRVYAVTGGGSYVGNENNSAAWTLVGMGITSDGFNDDDAQGFRVARVFGPFNTPLSIPMGTTQGLYITIDLVPNRVNYAVLTRQMPTSSSIVAQDANMQIGQGIGISYPFGTIDPQRAFCGGFYYETGLGPCTLPAPPFQYKTNVGRSTLRWPEVDIASIYTPQHLQSTPGSTERLILESASVGSPWDLGLSVGASPSGLINGIYTAGGQTVNLDIYGPSFVALNGGAIPDITTTSFPSASWEIPIPVTALGTISAQMINVNPTLPDGFSLSHSVEFSAQPLSFLESFEDPPLFHVAALPAGWHNLGTHRWVQWTGPSQRWLRGYPTGPATGAQAGRFYLLAEELWALPSDNYLAETCAYPVSGVGNFLSFELNRAGFGVGTLTVSVSNGTGGFTQLATYSGPTALPGWTNEVLPFTATTADVRFRFGYTNGNGREANMAIDEVRVQ